MILVAATLIASLLSCKKDESHVPKTYFEGKYEWQITESKNINGTSSEELFTIYPNDVGHNYGIVIKRSGKCFFYTDGELTSKGKITSLIKDTDPYSNMEPYFIKIDWYSISDMVFEASSNSMIVCRSFPEQFYNSRNQYFKIEE